MIKVTPTVDRYFLTTHAPRTVIHVGTETSGGVDRNFSSTNPNFSLILTEHTAVSRDLAKTARLRRRCYLYFTGITESRRVFVSHLSVFGFFRLHLFPVSELTTPLTTWLHVGNELSTMAIYYLLMYALVEVYKCIRYTRMYFAQALYYIRWPDYSYVKIT